MRIFLFAHRAEAQAWPATENCQRDPRLPELYWYFARDDNTEKRYGIYILGEGIWKAYEGTTRLLAQLEAQASSKDPLNVELINCGSARSLGPAFCQFEVLRIRSSYGHDGAIAERAMFHSEHDERAARSALETIDCISVRDRILDSDAGRKFLPLAGVADRELWGVARACAHFGVSWRAYKVISDHADEQVHCESVTRIAAKLSEALYRAVQTDLGETTSIYQQRQEQQDRGKLKLWEVISEDHAFHWSLQQSRQCKKLLNSIEHGQFSEIVKRVEAKAVELKQTGSRPKDRTKKLLEYIDLLLHPQGRQFDRLTNSFLRQTGQRLHRQLHFDLGEGDLVVRAKGKTKQDFSELAELLSCREFWDKFGQVQRGEHLEI